MKTSEFKTKLQRVRGFLKARKLSGVLLSTRANFSWLACVGTNQIRSDVEKGVASLWVTSKTVELWCNNIEEKRFREEEAQGLPLQYRVHPWNEDTKSQWLSKGAASDDGSYKTLNLKEEIAALRFSLTPEEITRYRQVGKSAGEVVDLVGHRVQKGWTEKNLATELSAELLLRGLEPTVVLVGADERLTRHRHPLPTKNKIERAVMMVICAKGHGLIVSLTRLVHFGPLSLDLKVRHRACLEVECAMWAKSKVGAAAGDIFKVAVSEYANHGHAGEWKKHHQGGPAGYETRDYLATPSEKRKLVENQALAWNPSITGTKSEDTVLLTRKGLEVLTPTPDWPMVKVQYGGSTYSRSDILTK